MLVGVCLTDLFCFVDIGPEVVVPKRATTDVRHRLPRVSRAERPFSESDRPEPSDASGLRRGGWLCVLEPRQAGVSWTNDGSGTGAGDGWTRFIPTTDPDFGAILGAIARENRSFWSIGCFRADGACRWISSQGLPWLSARRRVSRPCGDLRGHHASPQLDAACTKSRAHCVG